MTAAAVRAALAAAATFRVEGMPAEAARYLTLAGQYRATYAATKPRRCACLGCFRLGTLAVEYACYGGDGPRYVDNLCPSCAASFLRRPALHARIVGDLAVAA